MFWLRSDWSQCPKIPRQKPEPPPSITRWEAVGEIEGTETKAPIPAVSSFLVRVHELPTINIHQP